MQSRPNSQITHRLVDAARKIDAEGNEDEGGNRQAVFDAKSKVIDGYYPNETCYYVAVDLDDEKFFSSMTGTVQYVLGNHGLLYNSMKKDRFGGYHDHTEPIVADWIFHVVDVTWLPEEWAG
jgi:hypothetical protein